MKNPYKVPSIQTRQVRISKELIDVLNKIVKQEQKKADLKFGKGKFKVKLSYASKILGRDLK